jgi:DNA-binding transcriptional MerR regulator
LLDAIEPGAWAVEQRFTSSEVVSLTGITPRQLQWWDERGIVAPLREGRRRFYSPDDLAEVAVICELRRRGFSLQRVRKVMRFVQKEFGKRLVETVTAGSDYHLLTDGTHIFLETSAKQIIDILKNSRQPMLTVCISDTVRQVMPHLAAQQMTVPYVRSCGDGAVPRPNVLGIAPKATRKKKISVKKMAGAPSFAQRRVGKLSLRGRATRGGPASTAAYRRRHLVCEPSL